MQMAKEPNAFPSSFVQAVRFSNQPYETRATCNGCIHEYAFDSDICSRHDYHRPARIELIRERLILRASNTAKIQSLILSQSRFGEA